MSRLTKLENLYALRPVNPKHLHYDEVSATKKFGKHGLFLRVKLGTKFYAGELHEAPMPIWMGGKEK